MQTWRFSLAARIGLGVLAAFIFSIAALIFSLPLMYDNGDHSVDWIVILTAIVIVGFGIFATFALIVAIRTEITLGATALEATVVAGHNLLLVPRMREVRLPLAQIRSVERRCEIFRRLGLYTQREALSIVTADGERIGLFSNTLGTLSTLPIDEVANAIAAAAGIAVTDDGTVWAKGSGLYGAASSSWTERPLDAASASKARRAAVLTVQICTALLLLTFVLRSCL
ncbi:MAG TPA: hypothetical protein VFE16_04440 [Candidatus Cybelea sp.]|jgi:hypothetical protein|nr:hypothetical protein [Candidatus Cybelea sp.]